MFLQNNVALPVSGSFTLCARAGHHGPLPGNGQMPDFMRPLARTLVEGLKTMAGLTGALNDDAGFAD